MWRLSLPRPPCSIFRSYYHFATCGIRSLYADLSWFYRICNITPLVWTFQSKLKYKKHCSPAFVLRQLYVVNASGINNHSTKGTNTSSLKMNDLRFHCGIVSIFNYILIIIWVAQWSIVYCRVTTCNKTLICTGFTFDSENHLLSWMIF